MNKNFNADPPFDLNQYKTNPSPEDIIEDLELTEPLEINNRQKVYLGIKVQWNVLFHSVDDHHGKDSVYATASGLPISFLIDKSEDNDFSSMEEESPFWLCGEIEEADILGFELKNVKVDLGN